MKLIQLPETEIFQFDILSEFHEINHFISTRKGGTSIDSFSGLNISFETQDISTRVLENRKILARNVGIPLEKFVMQNQIHGNAVAVISQNDAGKGVFSHNTIVGNHDAMISNVPEICLFVFSADCVPILFYDPVRNVIGAAHAGWGGSVKKVAEKTVEAMTRNFGCRTEDIRAGIGPSIGVNRYEVGDNVRIAVEKAFGTNENYMFFNEKSKKYHFDLWYTNRKILTNCGLKDDNIETSGLCSFDNPEYFFSARRDEPTGRFGAGIMLKK